MSVLFGHYKYAEAASADAIRSYVYCIEDYKFLYVFTSYSGGKVVTIEQIMENNKGRLMPMECDGTEPKQIKPGPIKY